jgi:hypothetical protein
VLYDDLLVHRVLQIIREKLIIVSLGLIKYKIKNTTYSSLILKLPYVSICTKLQPNAQFFIA